MPSVVETIHDDLITEFSKIKEIDGYRNTVIEVEKIVREVSQVTNFPSLAVIPIAEKVTWVDTPATTFQSLVSFTVFGYVKSETGANRSGIFSTEMESLVHDCKKVLANLGISNLNTKRYFVSFFDEHGGVRVTRFFDMNQTKGLFTIDFTVKIHKSSSNFE